MIVPLTLADFLERAEHVYGDREAIVDEPNPPGGGLGRITYRQFASMSRSLAAALDDLGVAEGERVAIISPNAARFLVSLFGVSVFGFASWAWSIGSHASFSALYVVSSSPIASSSSLSPPHGSASSSSASFFW